MLMTPAQPQSADAASSLLQQMCITHCLREEGLYRQAGFTIRATSTLDPLLLRYALEYPSYELPVGMAGDKLSATPRRLALVRIPGGHSALIHSVHVPDERGRANNFFSHVLVRPTLTARAALAAWNSPDWRLSYATELGTDLPPLDELPASEAINDDAVTAFLQPVFSATDADGVNGICPRRLAGEPARRRELLQLALRGCLLAMQAGATAARGRFYLLAEPGLTALLVYAASRLMPDALAANLTFSTYENAHRDLRVYKQARIVGTYLADPARGLDAELFGTRGYALDTFAHQFSPELRSDAEPDIAEWIDLAARGDWATIDNVHRLLGKTSTSVVSFRESVQAAKVSIRMANGQASGEDLLVLKRASWGEAILEAHRGKLWPLVRGSATDERVRREFAEVLRDHLPEVEREAAKALNEQPPGDWQPAWHLLCAILKDDAPQLRDAVQRLLPEPPYAPGLRLALLSELHRCQLSPVDPRLPWHALLKQCTAEDLDQLAQSHLPREWFVLALMHALGRTESRPAAVRHLHDGNDELLGLFWEQFRSLKEESQRRTILAALFPADKPEGFRLLERLLILRPVLRVETLDWLLNTFGAFRREAADFWGRDNHLGLLLDLLRSLGSEADAFWDRLCGTIDPLLLAPGDPFQNTVLMELAAVKDRPGPALPRKTAQTIADWILLRDHFERATDVPESKRREVIDACNRLHFDSIDVLGRYFERFLVPQGTNKMVLDDFAGFFHSFFLAGMGYQDYGSRLIAWLQIVACCADESRRADYQLYYLENHVPLEFRWRLAEETHDAGRLLRPVFEQMEKMKPEGSPQTQAAKNQPQADVAIDELFQVGGVRETILSASVMASVGKRVPALLATLAGGLLAAWLSHVYRIQLQRVAVMVLFIPLILGLAESTVLQSLALTVRALREGTLTPAVRLRHLRREVLTGLLLGLLCGVIVSVVAGIWTRSWPLSLSLGGALAGGLASAAAAGGIVPSLLRLLRWDRGIASGPIARTLAGLLALLIYFGLACLLIRR
jgi:hypothetical protein